MGRVRAACIVLLLLAAFAVFGHIGITRTTDALLRDIRQAEQYVLDSDYSRAGEVLGRLTEYCEGSEPLLTLFVRRDLYNTLRTGVYGMEAYLTDQYRNDLLLELARAKAQVLALRQQYFSFV